MKKIIKISLPLLLVTSVSHGFSGEPHVHGTANMDLVYSENEIHIAFTSPLANLVGFEYKPQTKVEIFKYKETITKLNDAKAIAFSGIKCSPASVQVKAPWENLSVSDASESSHEEHDHHDEHKDHGDHDHHNEHKDHGDHDHHDEHKGHDDHDHHDEHKGHDDHENHDEHKGRDDQDHHNEHKGHGDRGHHNEHKGHGDHDHHDEHKGHDDHGHEDHADITVESRYKCETATGEINVEFKFMEEFPKLEEISLNWITDSLQGSVQVTPDSNKVVIEQ